MFAFFAHKCIYCVQVRCAAGGGTYEVQVRGKWLDCGTGSKTVQLSGRAILAGADDISITCPAAADVCADTTLDPSKVSATGSRGNKYAFTNKALVFWLVVAGVILLILLVVYAILCCLCDCLRCCCKSDNKPQRRSQQMNRMR